MPSGAPRDPRRRPSGRLPARGPSGRLGRPKASGKLARGIERALNPYVDEATLMAARFVTAAKERFGAELGYDLDHVRRLDNLIRTARDAFDDELVLTSGFYFAEVLRRVYGGRYQWHAGRDALSLEIEDLVTFPIEKLRQVVKVGGAASADRRDGLEAYLLVLAKRLLDRRAARRGDAAG